MARTESKYNFGSPKEDINKYMKEYMKIKIPCECGINIKRCSMALHKKSIKHLQQIELNKYKQQINKINMVVNQINT